MLSFAVFISGNGSNLQAIIDATSNGLIDGQICCVLSNKKEAYGLARAKKANIPTVVIEHLNYENREEFDNALLQSLQKYNPDLIVLAGFMRILTPVFIKPYLGKLINIHPSLLPKYPGLNTHQKVIANKDTEHGVTVHFVDENLDGGPICAQSIMKVESNDIETLEKRIHELEHELYPKVIQDFAKGNLELQIGKLIK
jgi:phosphoribosylglycinamide formyltransferase-1